MRKAPYHTYNMAHFNFLVANKSLPRNELHSAFNSHFEFHVSVAAFKKLIKRAGLTRTGSKQVPWSTEEVQFIQDNIQLENEELFSRFIAQFGRVRSRSAMCNFINYRGLRRTKTVRRSIEINGVKMCLHHFVWECVHGQLPPEHCVIFIDGDISNFRIENLKAVPRSAVSAAAGWLGGDMHKVNEAAISVCALRNRIKQTSVKASNY
ncbi:HNH endonuclease signature motif containing protein [Serratia marcescens]|uniref:HNH endonuclease signature motif containing protein n=1 Tax=Serratia marcescens TaxID=615 RepID=UPI0016609BDD|nr:HNH endonuclease signature motif containing protein [Serratia marcescens]